MEKLPFTVLLLILFVIERLAAENSPHGFESSNDESGGLVSLGQTRQTFHLASHDKLSQETDRKHANTFLKSEKSRRKTMKPRRKIRRRQTGYEWGSRRNHYNGKEYGRQHSSVDYNDRNIKDNDGDYYYSNNSPTSNTFTEKSRYPYQHSKTNDESYGYPYGIRNTRQNESITIQPQKLFVRVVEVIVPDFVNISEDVKLECRYNLTVFKLYSLKWYRNDIEIFRYMPGQSPEKAEFLSGNEIDIDSSTGSTLQLRNISLKSGGDYKCEVVSESPAYHTADRKAHMTVIQNPSKKPEVWGSRRHYYLGDSVRITCVSPPSHPHATLTWYINGEKAPSKYLRKLPLLRFKNGAYKSQTALDLQVTRSYLSKGYLNLRCSSKMPAQYPHEVKLSRHIVDSQISWTIPLREARDGAYTDACAGISPHLLLTLFLSIKNISSLMSRTRI